MSELLKRVRIRLPETELTDEQITEMLQTVSDRLCIALGVDSLPALFASICVDATVKMIRRIYYEGIATESAANISTSFVDNVLAEYADEIDAYRRRAEASGEGNVKVVRFL